MRKLAVHVLVLAIRSIAGHIQSTSTRVGHLCSTGSPNVGVSFDGRYASLAWPNAGEYAIYAARPDGAWTQIARSSGVAVAWAAVAASFAVLHVPRVGSSLPSYSAYAQCSMHFVQQRTCMHCPWKYFDCIPLPCVGAGSSFTGPQADAPPQPRARAGGGRRGGRRSRSSCSGGCRQHVRRGASPFALPVR